MDTITVRLEHGDTLEIPVAVAFGADGKPTDLIGDVEPEYCDHAGETWSSCFDLRCIRCGSWLFLPGCFLAQREEDVIERMHALWVAAGWPEFHGGSNPGWSIIPDKWTVIDEPAFAHVGGLPVRNDRLAVSGGDAMNDRDALGRFTPGNEHASRGGRRRAETLPAARRREIARGGAAWTGRKALRRRPGCGCGLAVTRLGLGGVVRHGQRTLKVGDAMNDILVGSHRGNGWPAAALLLGSLWLAGALDRPAKKRRR